MASNPCKPWCGVSVANVPETAKPRFWDGEYVWCRELCRRAGRALNPPSPPSPESLLRRYGLEDGHPTVVRAFVSRPHNIDVRMYLSAVLRAVEAGANEDAAALLREVLK
jgi:hypothetical protein